jgi:hypothetical protein
LKEKGIVMVDRSFAKAVREFSRANRWLTAARFNLEPTPKQVADLKKLAADAVALATAIKRVPIK